MFEFLRKRPSAKDSPRVCASLAREATIDVALEAGKYAGFLIRINEDGASLAQHFQHPEARSAFVDGVEARIREGEFNDPCEGIDLVAEGRRLTGWKPDTDVLRAVIGRAGTPLFTWEPGNRP